MANKVSNPYQIVLGAPRSRYVHVKEPASFEVGDDKKYDCTFLIKKDHPDVKKIKDVIKTVYDANKDVAFKGTSLTSKKMWVPLRDGEDWLAEHPEAKEYGGCYFLKASSKSQPAVFDKNKQDLLDLDEVYSGCFCRGAIVCYPFAKNGNKGFGFYLNSLLKYKDGERLGGFTASADDYDDGYADDAAEDDNNDWW
jgi:hypothetical protein